MGGTCVAAALAGVIMQSSETGLLARPSGRDVNACCIARVGIPWSARVILRLAAVIRLGWRRRERMAGWHGTNGVH
ncbi:MAG: hypothetical protein NVS2B7_24890 [Herpetosiphon sp.]